MSGAARLAGFAGLRLGWSPDAFWRATPAELAAVVGAAVGEDTPDVAALRRMMEDDAHG